LPIDYTIRDGLLSARAAGVLDDASLLSYVQAVMVDPDYETTVADLFDARAVTDVQLTVEGMRTIETIIRQSGLSSPNVAVVASSPAMFGMARMFAQLSEGVEVAVFREPAEALEWLRGRGLPRE
jgi:hypothetical protein